MSKKRQKTMSERQTYAVLESARDALIHVVNRQKFAWGYDNWARIHELTSVKLYSETQKLVRTFKPSDSKKYALQLLDDIIRYSRRLHLPY